MKEHGFTSGSGRSRRGLADPRGWALAGVALWLCACSGSTDVVGVLPTEVETGALEGAAQDDGSGIDGLSGATGSEVSQASTAWGRNTTSSAVLPKPQPRFFSIRASRSR